MADPIPLTWNEALSGIFGSISLAAWIFLLLPQLVENYNQGHADGISLTFLLIWMVGDVTNLAGAVWAGLVPTVVALAVYFCFADVVLIAQSLYYRGLKKGARKEAGEQAPLLQEQQQRRRLTDVTEENLGLPGSRRSNERMPSREEPPRRTHISPWLKNTASILLIMLAGAAGWAVAWRTGAWRPTPVEKEVGQRGPVGAEMLGYASAVAYLGARIPQIVKNQRERSCEGLSLLFFLLSVMGNATYGAGILFHSVDLQYFLTNLPWLIGSLGTIAEDIIIFMQFSVFGERKEEEQAVEEG